MENKNILDIGSLLSDFNQEAASKFGQLFQEKLPDQVRSETDNAATVEKEEKAPIGDYDVTYQEICHLLNNIKQIWGTDDTERNWFDPQYQRDLLYLYDRITLDMKYLKEYPERNSEWLEELLELKYEIRNLL